MTSNKQLAKRTILLYLISMLLINCSCPDSFKIMGSGSLTIRDNVSIPSDTITTAFNVVAFLESEIISNPCGDQTFENSVLENSVILTLSKDFVFNQDTISSGTNILNINSSNQEIEMLLYDDVIDIKFNIEFIEKCNLSIGEYIVTLKAKTNDSIEIENSQVVYFNIQ